MRKLIRDGENIIKFDYSFLVGGKKFFSDREVILDLYREDRFFGINSFILADYFYEKKIYFLKNMEIEVGRWLCP
jgi:hypothetical protein